MTRRATSLSIALALLATAAIRGGQQPPAPPTPLQLANQAERQRIMNELKISAIPPGAVSSSPATYNEADANPYPILPDPLTLKNGQKVTSAAVWRSKRRAELLEDFQREIYGRTPKNVPKVVWKVVSRTEGADADVPTITKQLLGFVDNAAYPSLDVIIQATVTTPANASRAVPVIMQFGGGLVPLPEGTAAPANPCAPPGGFGARGAGPAGPGRGGAPAGPASPQGPTWQQQLLAKGWGYANLNTGSVQGDCGAGLTAGIIGLVNKGQPRKLDDWGALSAWGWGASRLLDYMETDKSVDAKRVGVTGHSRAGKAALVAMAFDERFAIGYISSSGHGGAKLHRRKYGETIENVANTYYHWMAGNYLKYTARWDTMPVDSHELIALCAPRPVFLSAGNNPGPVGPDGTVAVNDAWVDARGSFLAAVGAGPVYKLLGAKDLGTTEFPPIDTAIIEGDLGFRQHTAGHTPAPTWPTFITFASRYFDRGLATPTAPREGTFGGAPMEIGVFEGSGDVGKVLHAGSVTYDPAKQTYAVRGSGHNMWATDDAFYYVWKKVSGDVSIAADITWATTGGNAHKKAVLVMRQTLDADSPYVDAAAHGDGTFALQSRDTKGAVTHEVQANAPRPKRLRLTKSGQYFHMAHAADGEPLQPSGGSVRVALQEPFYVGIGVCAHDANVVEAATFSNVTVAQGSPQPTTEKPKLYSVLETVTISSADRRTVRVFPARAEAPNWTKDNVLIYNSGGLLYRIPVAGGDPVAIDTGFATRNNNDHGISPDGTMLAISDQSQETRRSIVYTVPIGGGTPTRITKNFPSYWHGWSPDGKTLAFVGERNKLFDIYTIPAAGGEETRITDADGLDDGPDYSPDGQFIYFNSERTGTMQIWRMRPDGSAQEQITADGYNNWFPHPSPDGQQLVFLSYEKDVRGHPENKDVMLKVMTIADKKVTVLAKLFGGQGTINVPSWSPDSRRLAFVSYLLLPE